jgi:hypothetical protein
VLVLACFAMLDAPTTRHAGPSGLHTATIFAHTGGFASAAHAVATSSSPENTLEPTSITIFNATASGLQAGRQPQQFRRGLGLDRGRNSDIISQPPDRRDFAFVAAKRRDVKVQGRKCQQHATSVVGFAVQGVLGPRWHKRGCPEMAHPSVSVRKVHAEIEIVES